MSNNLVIQQEQKISQYSGQVEQLFKSNWKAMQSVISNTLTPQRLARIALFQIRQNPELADCEPMSFVASVMQCAALGLEPGSALGHAYLIPYFNSKKSMKEVSLQIGYRGMLSIVRRSGQVSKISARAVYEGDDFQVSYGLNEDIQHTPTGADGDPAKIIAVYAVAHLKDGFCQFEVLTRGQIDAIKAKHAKNNPVWNSHFEEMAKKTAIRRLFKMLPQALLADDEHRLAEIESVESIIDTAPADGTWIQQIPPGNSGAGVREETKRETTSAMDHALNDKIAAVLALGHNLDSYLPPDMKGKSPAEWSAVQKNSLIARLTAVVNAEKAKG